MHKNILVISLILTFTFVFGLHAEAADDVVMNLLRPKLKGEQTSPTWIEINYVIIDARHPQGIEKLQLVKPDAKQAERSFTEADRHKSGYFIFNRRFKSGEIRDYKILLWPRGTNPDVDPPITSDMSFAVEYRDPKPAIPNYLGFTNLSEGSVVRANDPAKADDLTYIYLDCMDASGTWGKGTFKKDMHVGYKDDDGINWVELVIAGPDGEKVVRNERALIFDKEQKSLGPYWGEAEDPQLKKAPDEPWPAGVKWKPIEGFGLHEFAVSLKPGTYTLHIRAQNNKDEIVTGPSISITSVSKNDENSH